MFSVRSVDGSLFDETKPQVPVKITSGPSSYENISPQSSYPDPDAVAGGREAVSSKREGKHERYQMMVEQQPTKVEHIESSS